MTHRTDTVDPPFGGRRRRPRTVGAAVAAVALVGALALPSAAHVPPAAASSPIAAATTVRSTGFGAGQYELMDRSGQKPLRWLACRPIRYRINPAGMPKGMTSVVRASMQVVAEQTGVAFRYAGTTRRTFDDTARPEAPTVYFSFTPKRKAYGRVFSWPGEIGIGGPTGAWATGADGEVFEAVTSGRVLLSTSFRGPRRGAGATWQSLIVHEVGHALNLAHRRAARDIMHASLTSDSPGRFRPKELAALQPVLQRTGCDYRAWSRL